MRTLGVLSGLALCLCLVACGGDDVLTDAGPLADAGVDMPPDPPVEPDTYCPGPGCADEGDDVLYVGAAKVDISPVIDETTEIQTLDVNGDGLFQAFMGDTFRDTNGNGVFDGVWIAGYDVGRPASGIDNPTWARAIALRRNGITMALVAIDVVGYFNNEIEAAREYVRDMGVDVDFVSVTSTHVHEARDTIGIWGPDFATTGVDLAYQDSINRKIAEAVHDAVAALEPAHVSYASTFLRDQPGGQLQYIGDARDPFILDDEIRIMNFTGAESGETIATLVNTAGHPEVTGRSNQLISSDYPNWLREAVENGVQITEGSETTELPGIGGICVFYQGALGVQIGPARTMPIDFNGTALDGHSQRTAEVLGTRLGQFVLEALADTANVVTDETAALGFRSFKFLVHIQNRVYHIGFRQGLFHRDTLNSDPERPIYPGINEPDIETEVSVIDIGRAQILGVPGELDPALFVGGYDGSYTPAGREVVDTTRTNPADLSMAPTGPYLRDLAREDAEYVYLFGLTNDQLGYFVVPFDYELNPNSPYLIEATGSHYEETNSIGIDGWPRINDKLTQLLAWRPDESP